MDHVVFFRPILFHTLTINIRILRTTCVPIESGALGYIGYFKKLPVSPVESGLLGYIGYFKFTCDPYRITTPRVHRVCLNIPVFPIKSGHHRTPMTSIESQPTLFQVPKAHLGNIKKMLYAAPRYPDSTGVIRRGIIYIYIYLSPLC